MPSPDYDRAVQQPLLDRLIDLDPEHQVESHLTRAESLRRLRASVRRDIEWLLNTIRVNEAPANLNELKNSLYTFGIPDIASMSLESAQDSNKLLRGLERAIAQFEPRLASVRVSTHDTISRKQMYIEFRIDAVLMIDPVPERLSFDTIFEVARGAYKVKDQ
jgi:type VI secretion system protein ImpF